MAQQSQGARSQYLTFGPDDNEVQVEYSVRDASHTIVFTHRVSPDLVLLHQAKVAGFYRKLSSSADIRPAPRSVKNQILRDTFSS